MTFNIADLHEFHKNVPIYPNPISMRSSFEEEGTDEGHNWQGIN